MASVAITQGCRLNFLAPVVCLHLCSTAFPQSLVSSAPVQLPGGIPASSSDPWTVSCTCAVLTQPIGESLTCQVPAGPLSAIQQPACTAPLSPAGLPPALLQCQRLASTKSPSCPLTLLWSWLHFLGPFTRLMTFCRQLSGVLDASSWCPCGTHLHTTCVLPYADLSGGSWSGVTKPLT